MISKLQAAGALRPGLTVTRAVGLLSILCSTEAFAALTTRHGWTADQCETWTTSALCQLLLRESGQAGV